MVILNVSYTLRLVSMGRLIPMRMGRHIGGTSSSHEGLASSQFEGVDDGATSRNLYILINEMIWAICPLMVKLFC
ncbi:hypothetical protein Hanom_Chr07g00628991 [Helianthus anomalus]